MKPKLTLRDLFWLVLVCALVLGWWADRQTAFRHLVQRFHGLEMTADQMALFIEQKGLGRVAYGTWGVSVGDVTLPRPADWESLPKKK